MLSSAPLVYVLSKPYQFVVYLHLNPLDFSELGRLLLQARARAIRYLIIIATLESNMPYGVSSSKPRLSHIDSVRQSA